MWKWRNSRTQRYHSLVAILLDKKKKSVFDRNTVQSYMYDKYKCINNKLHICVRPSPYLQYLKQT